GRRAEVLPATIAMAITTPPSTATRVGLNSAAQSIRLQNGTRARRCTKAGLCLAEYIGEASGWRLRKGCSADGDEACCFHAASRCKPGTCSGSHLGTDADSAGAVKPAACSVVEFDGGFGRRLSGVAFRAPERGTRRRFGAGASERSALRTN